MSPISDSHHKDAETRHAHWASVRTNTRLRNSPKQKAHNSSTQQNSPLLNLRTTAGKHTSVSERSQTDTRTNVLPSSIFRCLLLARQQHTPIAYREVRLCLPPKRQPLDANRGRDRPDQDASSHRSRPISHHDGAVQLPSASMYINVGSLPEPCILSAWATCCLHLAAKGVRPHRARMCATNNAAVMREGYARYRTSHGDRHAIENRLVAS